VNPKTDNSSRSSGTSAKRSAENAVAWAVIDCGSEEILSIEIGKPDDSPGVRYEPLYFAASETQERLCVLVPDSWLDPLLTGPDAVLKGPGPWGCAEIEALLKAVRTRIRKAEHAARR